MALTNFLLTVGAVGAVILLMRTDIRDSSRMLQRNAKTIRTWLEEQQATASKAAKSDPKQVPGSKPDKIE